MTVLSNSALVSAMDAGRIRITPRPDRGASGGATPFGTCSVDLHLSSDIYVPRAGLQISLDIQGQIGSTLDAIYDRYQIPSAGWVLPPNRFILGGTIERIELPLVEGCLAARIEGRSSFARTGLLVHFTAPTIHPGFDGKIALEMINLGEYPLVLRPSLPVCQLIVETVEGIPVRRDSQFQHQATPTGAA